MSSKLSELHTAVAQRAEMFLKLLEDKGLRPIIAQGYRSIEEQDELFSKGRRGIKGEKIVTNARGGESWHNYGVAFDLAFLTPKGNLTYDVDWSMVGELGESLGLEWGGRWKNFPDRPHFQLTDTLTIPFMLKQKDWRAVIDRKLDPYIIEVKKPSPWAEDAVKWCIEQGIAVDWSDPQAVTNPQDIETMLHRANLIKDHSGKGMSKEQWATLIYRLSQ